MMHNIFYNLLLLPLSSSIIRRGNNNPFLPNAIGANRTNLRQLEIDYGIANHQIRTTQEEIVTFILIYMTLKKMSLIFLSIFTNRNYIMYKLQLYTSTPHLNATVTLYT